MAMHRGDNGTAGSSVILIGSERAGALVASSRFRPPLCALRLSRRPVPTSKAGRHSHLTQGKLYLLRHPRRRGGCALILQCRRADYGSGMWPQGDRADRSFVSEFQARLDPLKYLDASRTNRQFRSQRNTGRCSPPRTAPMRSSDYVCILQASQRPDRTLPALSLSDYRSAHIGWHQASHPANGR